MLVAKLGNDMVVADLLTEEERRLDYKCPGCGEDVIPKLGSQVIHHFAHKIDSACSYGAGETIEHELCKLNIYKALIGAGYNAQMEVPLIHDGVNRRMDIAADIDGRLVAFEIQQSTIEPWLLNQRTNDYTKCGVAVAWIYVGESFTTDMVKTMQKMHSGVLFTAGTGNPGVIHPVRQVPKTRWVESTDYGGGYLKYYKKQKDMNIAPFTIRPWEINIGTNREGQLVGRLPYKMRWFDKGVKK